VNQILRRKIMSDSGTKTSEFWMTTIAAIVAAVLPILVAYGVLTSEMAELWKGLIMAIVAAVVPIAVGSLAKTYTVSRTEVKLARIQAGIE
jgi:hypothetical protein